MPSWRKVIVSGSDATLNSVTTPSGTINSMTASFAMTASSTTAVAGTTNYVPKFTSGTAIGNSQIFDNGTNVGVGTASPIELMSLYKSTRPYISIQNATTGTTSNDGMFFGHAFGDLDFEIRNKENSAITVWTNNAERMRITSGGNVGIGTASPSQKLTIGDGTGIGSQYIRINNSASDIYIGQSGGTIFGLSANSAQLIVADNTSYPLGIGTTSALPFILGTNNTERMRITSAGNVGIGTTSPSSKLHLSGTTTLLTITATTYNRTSNIGYLDNANLYFANDSDSNTYIGRYNNLFLAYGGGNVGIGTTSPSSILSIYKGSGENAYIEVAGNGNTIGSTSVVYGQDMSNNAYVWNRANANIYFGTNNSTKMFLSAAGNLGIGTTSPSTKLHVGAASVNQSSISTSNSSNLGLFVQATGNDNVTGNLQSGISFGEGWSGLYSYDAGGSGAQGLGIFTGTNSSVSERMRITNAGAIKFNAYGSGTFTGTVAYTLAVDSSGNIIETTGGGGAGTVNSGTSGYLAYYPSTGTTVDDTSGVYWDSGNSRLGIGTTSPGAKLDITSTSGDQLRISYNSTFYWDIGREAADGRLSFTDSQNGEKLTILTSGNVGIGKTSPNTKLDVNGNTLITGSLRVTAGITGSLSGNADTVTWTDSDTSTFAIATSDGTTAYYDAAGDLRWDGAAKVLSVAYSGEQLNLNGKYIEQTGTGLLNYYADRHVFGDNAYNYQGQLIGGSFDAAQDITCGGTKYFDIPHQTKPGWGLKHGAIEGPESAVYFRGKLNDSNIIEFPAYWEWLVHSESITVSLTPIGSFQPLYVAKIENNQAVIASNDQPINCHFVVYGERKDVEQWDVEYPGYSRGQIADTE